MGLIDFNKPKKKRSTAKHNEMYSSDAGIDGTYVPNMSLNDMYKWKGKHIKGSNERIEIRKTFSGVQVLIVVYKEKPFEQPDWEIITGKYSHSDREKGYDKYKKLNDQWRTRENNIKISMNGSTWMSFTEFESMRIVIDEAKEILNIK